MPGNSVMAVHCALVTGACQKDSLLPGLSQDLAMLSGKWPCHQPWEQVSSLSLVPRGLLTMSPA